MQAWCLKALEWMLQVGFYQNFMSVLQYKTGQKNGTEGCFISGKDVFASLLTDFWESLAKRRSASRLAPTESLKLLLNLI